ncbi:sirohydrochlorin chelatase [Halalkalibacterium ligniniphilum]|uniref:sirohydrochlorin chelatase n=1 Tax=Halalkalibacterium ligniniphilum TaxID=1134413 RepID=UPI00034A2F89|nr:sirohydrochlorin chelatase [Halalkalibacterium ligniniphilum]
MKAVLLVGHGSRDPEGNEQVRQSIEQLKSQIEENFLLETCFLEFESPNVNQGIDTCVAKGATHVYVIPIMLLAAGHSKIHIPAAIDQAKETYPDVHFTYGRPIGMHQETIEICKSRLQEVEELPTEKDEETAILLLGRGGSDPDANSDLYKITRLLWENLNYKIVETAFMGVTDPLVREGVERCIKLGAKRVIILPYFLFTGILIKRLEEMIVEFEAEYPGCEFKLAEYFGFHTKLQTILLDRIHEALQENVKMNCDTCQYRIAAMEHIDHHHHDHHHHHHHHHEVHKS